MTTNPPLSHHVPLGTSDLNVSQLCLGGNVFGWTADRETSFAVLDAYLAAGGNFIDSADSYSYWVEGNVGGESETIIGEWVTARGNRDRVIIATKVGKQPETGRLTPENIAISLDASLRRLGTDYLDLYYFHHDDPSVPLEDSLGAFDAAVRAGKVRHIAASNFTPERLTEALEISKANGLAPFVALQNHYNLVERSEYEGAMRDVVTQYGLGSLPYYSLARGFLTGKYKAGTAVDSPRAGGAAAYLHERGIATLAALEAVAERHDASMATVALAWLLAQPTVTAPISSARILDQLVDLLPMVNLHLDDQDLAELDAASA